MVVKEIILTKELKDHIYCDLIDFAQKRFSLILFVVRPGFDLEETGQKLLRELNCYKYIDEQSEQWPGTKLVGSKACVFFYNFTVECAQIIKQYSKSLYEWQNPILPEDICIMRNKNQPWLCTIAHERTSMLYLTTEEKKDLLSAIPGLSELLGEEFESYAYY